MSRIIDISITVQNPMPLWTGSPGWRLDWLHHITSDFPANVSMVTTEVHTGTHIDAPLHFVPNGKSVEQMDLSVLVGEAVVAYLPNIQKITAQDLENLNLPIHTKRLLLKTDNSKWWKEKKIEFQKDFVALTADAAQWIVDSGIRLIGIDYLAIQLYEDGPQTHQILLHDEVVILETIDLSEVEPGMYELICLPIKWKGAEAAPVRAVLRTLN